MSFLLAHIGPGEHGLVQGLLHPITGADHLVAAVAVGLLARLCVARGPARASDAQERRAGSPATRALTFPLAFVIGMTVGGTLARLGVALPGVEFGIALSLVAVGVALAFRKIGPTPVAAGALAIFAAFHGHAHLAEYDAATGLAGYAVGLVLATALLHAAGVGLTLAADRFKLPTLALARAAGVATLAFGVLKLAGIA